jgi:hypothetical protein
VAFSLAALKTEINTDPKTLGYATLLTQTNGPEAVAAKLNEIGASAETLFKAYVPIEDVVACIVRADYDALGAVPKAFLNDVLLVGARLKSGDANLRASVVGVFGVSTTKTNLTNLASRSCTRAEALWGEGASVSPTQVADALAS